MKQFKKKTLALILASTITVVGAFSAENYKNSLMSLKLDSDSSNAVSITLQTKQQYTNTITPTKKDANTYVIMLPETDGRNAESPELTGNVENVNVSTMPYTKDRKGYTKITIKTLPNTSLTAKSAVYIEDKSGNNYDSYKREQQLRMEQRMLEEQKRQMESEAAERKAREEAAMQVTANTSDMQTQNDFSPTVQESRHQFESTKQRENSTNIEQENSKNTESNLPAPEPEDNTYTVLFVLGALFVVFACVFLYIKGRNKMAEIVGEDLDFSIDEEKPKTDKKQKKRIRKTISALDKMYDKPVKMPVNIQPTPDIPVMQNSTPDLNQDYADENLIVDLDELFQEKSLEEETPIELENEDNNDLDDFLSGFDFENDSENIESKPEIDEMTNINQMFEKYIQHGDIKFSKEDVEKINKLINIEITDETFNNLDKYLVSDPIKEAQIKHSERLEDIITSYAINQNIQFTKDDVDALDKISRAELDPSFVTDLSTNPERTKQMQKEIESRQVSHKKREMLTLHVKNLLPDLSEALKKQGGKRIESEVKPEVVYYSEGYDVSTLSVSDSLPDLVLDFDNPEYNKYRPSDEIQIVEQGYEVQKLEIKDELPDLSDVAANPEKYSDKKEKVKVDEDSLLKNIQNVTFKPFYDGYENFEIANKFDDNPITEENEKNEENEENDADLDKYTRNIDFKDTENEQKTTSAESRYPKNVRNDENAQKLLELIETQQNERKLKAQKSLKEAIENKVKTGEKALNKNSVKKVCVAEGETYEILSTSSITDSIGCHLAKGKEGYTILGYINDKVFKIKYYETVNTQKIQSRLNETLDNGIVQYIVRIGLHKFILNVSGDNMEYVMDLC